MPEPQDINSRALSPESSGRASPSDLNAKIHVARVVNRPATLATLVETPTDAPGLSDPPAANPIIAGGLSDANAQFDVEVDSSEPVEPAAKRPSLIRRFFGFIRWSIYGTFSIASLIVLLAVITAVPIFQLIAFGYLLSVAGELANGRKFRDSLPQLKQAGQIGLASVAVFMAALPTQLLSHWESVAAEINPDSGHHAVMRFLAIAFSLIALLYLLWAWARGGTLKDYLWPQPKRFLREGWRWSTWKNLPDRLWDFTVSLEAPKYFWLGLRGAVGTLVWLIPAIIIIQAFREGETGAAGLLGFLSLLLLGISMFYLPMLQAHFAAENRTRALFEVKQIRADFRAAPWAWLLAMIVTLVLTPIPLYLLKIEATPREVMWAPLLIVCRIHASGTNINRIGAASCSAFSRQSRYTLAQNLSLAGSILDGARRRDLPGVSLCVAIHQLGRIEYLGSTARDLDPRAFL